MIQKVLAGAVSTEFFDPVEGKFLNIGDMMSFVVNLIIGIGWGLVFIMLALGFVQYVMSKGEKTAVDSAQKWLTYAVIGGVGLFFIGFAKRILPQLIGADDTAISTGVGGGVADF